MRRVWSFLPSPSPCPSATGALAVTLGVHVPFLSPFVCPETAVPPLDTMYGDSSIDNVLYVELCPRARLVERSCVVSVDDHDSQMIKRP